MNASSERGIGVVRDKIKNFSKAMVTKVPGLPSLKLIVLDEADSMTHDAQSALRRIIEDYSESTRFCIICNYISKIIEPIGSRCIKYRFKPIPPEAQVTRLAYICEQEAVSHEPDALPRLIQISGGDLRKSVNLLQLCANTFQKHLTAQSVEAISGVVPPSSVLLLLQTVTRSVAPAQVMAVAREVQRMGLAADSLLAALMAAVL
jgi:replication factor C subunit 2/4